MPRSEVITFWGSSDDLIEIDGKPKGCDEYYALASLPHEFELRSKEGKLRVICHYGENGTWSFAPALSEEEEDFPGWMIQFYPADNGYSMAMRVTCPPDVEVIDLAPRDDD